MRTLCVPTATSRSLSVMVAIVLAASVALTAPAVSPGIIVNDNISTAMPAPLETPITETFMAMPATVHRVYSVALEQGDTLVVAGGVQSGDPFATSEALVFDPTATDVTLDDPVALAEEGTSTVQFTAPSAGTYYIDIMSQWSTYVAYGWMVMVVPGEGGGEGPGEIEPVVTFEPDLVSFTAEPGGLPPASQTVTITIDGFETPEVNWYLFDIPEWLTITPSNGIAPGVNVMQVEVDTGAAMPGEYYDALVQVAIEVPVFPAGFARIARMPTTYGSLPVSLDFRIPSTVESLAVSPASPTRSSTDTPTTTVSGRLAAEGDVDTETVLAGQVVDIMSSLDGVTYSWCADAVTDAEGAFSCEVPVARKTYLKVEFAGNDVLGVSNSEAQECVPGAYLLRPTAPDRVSPSTSFATYGYLYPKHASTYPVTLRFYRYERMSGGEYGYVYKKSVSGKRIDSSSSRIRYKCVTSLKYAGKWRVRAVHSDTDHKKSYSAYDYFVVR